LREGATQVVTGRGPKDAKVVIIGEAPGKEEDKSGKPFVGRSGKLLSEALKNSGLKEKDVYISNVIKCRPPENRTPTREEIGLCKKWLDLELDLIKPDFIMTLGETAMFRLLDFKGIASRRGKVHRSAEYGKVFVTYHPAAALRNVNLKKVFMSDVARFVRLVKGKVRKREKLESIVSIKGTEDKKLVHLHVHDEFSVLDGCGKAEEFVGAAKRLGMGTLATTNHRSISGVPSFLRACDKGGIKPIVGCEIEVVDDMYFKDKSTRGKARHLITWCDGQQGYDNLLKLVTLSNVEGFYFKPRVDWDMLKKYKDGLVFGTACLGGPLCKAIMEPDEPDPDKVAKRLKKILGDNLFVEIMATDQPQQRQVNKALIDIAKYHKMPLVATVDAHYPTPRYADVHDILLMVQMNNTIRHTNRFKFDTKQLYLIPSGEMKTRLLEQGLPPDAVRKAMRNTVVIGKTLSTVKIPKLNVKDALPASKWKNEFRVFEKRTMAKWRAYKKNVSNAKRSRYIKRFKYELEVIQRHGLINYFLITTDIINYCKAEGIRTGSRGSAAGSLVAFLFGITKVDPLVYDLMFERFLGPERLQSGSLPDIDLDIDYTRREEVIKYVCDKYGEDHVSPSCTFSRMRGKAVLKDVARTQCIPVKEIEAVTELIQSEKEDESSEEIFSVIEDAVQQFEVFRKFEKKYPLVVRAALKLEGQVRHLGVHPAGYFITNSKISEITPIIKTGNRFVTGYEASDLEKIGLTKFDFLGLRTLSVIEQASKTAKVNIDDIPTDDEKVYYSFSQGHTRGIFQFDGGATRLLKQWHSQSILDLTMVNAANRPGPLQSGMTRRIMDDRNERPVDQQNSALEELLKETHGALIYQEQAMKILREVGGLSLLDVDKVRKLIAKSKGVAEIEKHRLKFVKGARKNGFTKTDANDIFSFLSEFGGYGFNRSHAAVYAYLAYQTMWLKVHYPAAFIAAYLSVHTGTQDITLLVSEALRLGVKILPPSIEKSDVGFKSGKRAVRIGLGSVPYIGVGAAKEILNNRPFTSYGDFLNRVNLGKLNARAVKILAEVGAFSFPGISNRTIAEKHQDIIEVKKGLEPDAKIKIKNLSEYTEDEFLQQRGGRLGLPLGLLKLSEFRMKIQAEGDRAGKSSKKFRLVTGLDVDLRSDDLIVVAINSVREHKTKNRDLMAFLSIADETGERGVIAWPSTYEMWKQDLKVGNIIAFRPKVKDGELFMEANRKFRCLLRSNTEKED